MLDRSAVRSLCAYELGRTNLDNLFKACCALAKLAENDSMPLPDQGICKNLLPDMTVPFLRYLRVCFASWEKYSGNPSYPIPAPWYYKILYCKIKGASSYYHRTIKWHGRRKQLRIELLNHVIDCIQFDVSSMNIKDRYHEKNYNSSVIRKSLIERYDATFNVQN